MPHRKKQRKLFKAKLKLFLLLVFFAGSGWLGWWAYSIVITLPNPERIIYRDIAQSTKIYDRTGQILLYEIHGEEDRTIVPLSRIPRYMQLATIAAEDINFYNHIGVDFKGILRAFIKNITSGDIKQGGSTITQQLIKNSILTPERTFKRKIKEALLAVVLESKYTKNEILEMYLNQIPYGSNAYGVGSAAEKFFGKDVSELTLAESALLAALPKAPTYFSPYGSNKDKLIARQYFILDQMVKAGFINKQQADKAKKQKLIFAPPKQFIKAPHFVLYVREYLNNKFGEDFVERGGLTVITTLDWELQKKAEKIVKEGAEKNEKLVKAGNAALVAIDPRTGEILAMVGSKDYWGEPFPKGCNPGVNCRFDPHVNVATRKRQPGSAFKPFVYATAINKGYTPETVLFDVFTEFNPLCNPNGTPGPKARATDCYHPRNYDGAFHGPVSLRSALGQSLNIPAVKLLYLVGIKDAIKTAQQMGITTLTQPDRYGLALVLGGAEVTLLEMTSAFGVFAQDGVLHPKTSIISIKNDQGIIIEQNKNISQEVLNPETARIINDMLSDNNARIPTFSPRSALYFPDRQVAAKTGTTQEFKDAWTIGYTPSLSVGVWVGNNDNTPIKQKRAAVMVSAPIWRAFLEEALKGVPVEKFTPPKKQVVNNPALRGIYREGPVVKIDKISGKLATEYTPKELIKEVWTGPVKTILALVDKKNPNQRPTDLEIDPLYRNWQYGVDLWMSSHPLPAPSIPTQPDNIHTPENKPNIQLLYPNEQNPIISKLGRVDVSITSTYPLKEITLFLDQELIGFKSYPIPSRNISFKIEGEISPGDHILKINAYDTVGNNNTKEIHLTTGVLDIQNNNPVDNSSATSTDL